MNERVYNNWDYWNEGFLSEMDSIKNNIASLIDNDYFNNLGKFHAIESRIALISQDEGKLNNNILIYPNLYNAFITKLKEFIKFLEEEKPIGYEEMIDLLLNKYLTQHCDAAGFSSPDNDTK